MGVLRRLAWLFGLIPLLTAMAFAHAAFTGSTPEAGAELKALPTELRLNFNEIVSPVVIKLIASDGTVVATGTPTLDGTSIVIPVTGKAGAGAFIISYRINSGDGHLISASIPFSVDAPSPVKKATPIEKTEQEIAPPESLPPVATAAAPAPLPQPVAIETDWSIPRWIVHASLLLFGILATGRLLYAAIVVGADQGATRRTALVPAIIAAMAAIAAIPLEGVYLLGAGPAGLFTVESWQTGVTAPIGGAAAISAIGLTLFAMSARLTSTGAAAGAVVLGIALFTLSRTIAGHAQTANPHWLAQVATASHVLIAAFWYGSLMPLRQLVQASDTALAVKRLETFSSVAGFAVLLLIAAGVTLAMINVQKLEMLVGTPYGRMIMAKLVLLALVLGLATWNKYRLTAALARGEVRARGRLTLSITIEMVAITLIILASSVLAKTQPPRSIIAMAEHTAPVEAPPPSAAPVPVVKPQPLAAPAKPVPKPPAPPLLPKPVRVSWQEHGMSLSLTIEPMGNHLMVALDMTAADGAPVKPVEARIRFARPDLGIEPVETRLQPGNGSSLMAHVPGVSIKGKWQGDVRVFVTDYDETLKAFMVTIP